MAVTRTIDKLKAASEKKDWTKGHEDLVSAIKIARSEIAAAANPEQEIADCEGLLSLPIVKLIVDELIYENKTVIFRLFEQLTGRVLERNRTLSMQEIFKKYILVEGKLHDTKIDVESIFKNYFAKKKQVITEATMKQQFDIIITAFLKRAVIPFLSNPKTNLSELDAYLRNALFLIIVHAVISEMDRMQNLGLAELIWNIKMVKSTEDILHPFIGMANATHLVSISEEMLPLWKECMLWMKGLHKRVYDQIDPKKKSDGGRGEVMLEKDGRSPLVTMCAKKDIEEDSQFKAHKGIGRYDLARQYDVVAKKLEQKIAVFGQHKVAGAHIVISNGEISNVNDSPITTIDAEALAKATDTIQLQETVSINESSAVTETEQSAASLKPGIAIEERSNFIVITMTISPEDAGKLKPIMELNELLLKEMPGDCLEMIGSFKQLVQQKSYFKSKKEVPETAFPQFLLSYLKKRKDFFEDKTILDAIKWDRKFEKLMEGLSLYRLTVSQENRLKYVRKYLKENIPSYRAGYAPTGASSNFFGYFHYFGKRLAGATIGLTHEKEARELFDKLDIIMMSELLTELYDLKIAMDAKQSVTFLPIITTALAQTFDILSEMPTLNLTIEEEVSDLEQKGQVLKGATGPR